MADIDLPVFPFRPNWREPMAERISFLTDVLASSSGAEQRRTLRQTPRRSFEADFLLSGPERTFFDLFVNKAGGGEITAPLYWEVVTIPATLTAGVSTRIDFDTTNREWAYHEGRLGLLIGDSALEYSVVEIAAVDAGGVDLAVAPGRSWPKGTRFYPLRRVAMEQVGDLTHKTAGVATVTAELRVVGPNPWEAASSSYPVYAGLPVFTDEPNWVEDLTVEFGRDLKMLDTGIGLTYQTDPLGRALLGQAHRWFLDGRDKLAGFRDLIYRHQGRAGAFWLPTFKADLRLVASAASSATQIQVERAGLIYTGCPTSGREYIVIEHKTGRIVRRITSVEIGSTEAIEKINLDASLGLALSPGQVRRISFVDTARFDTDDFELLHHGGIDGLHTVSALFRTFKNSRTTPTPIHFPIPVTAMGSSPCGATNQRIVNVRANVHGASTAAGLVSKGVTISGFSPSDVLYLSQPPGQTYSGWSPWGRPNFSSFTASSGSYNKFWVLRDGNPATLEQIGDNTRYNGYAAAREAFIPDTVSGGSSYTFGIIDSPVGDNSGGLSILVETVI